jgi:3-deoxy-D-manno-octulosonate 8-phosphate phosphatase (KDO 8-P phosphatase)
MNYKVKLKEINTFIFDVDGVLTDGTVLVNGSDYQRTLNSKDSYAIQYACRVGFRFFFITGGDSPTIKSTYEALGVTKVCLRSSNKLQVFFALKETYGLREEQCLYMGDDIPDLPVMRQVGLATAPHDASTDVLHEVAYISPFDGGKGAVRDIIEQTLRVQGKWLLDEAYHW